MAEIDSRQRNDDDALKSALFDVPIPVGLAERLKSAARAHLRQIEAASSTGQVPTPPLQEYTALQEYTEAKLLPNQSLPIESLSTEALPTSGWLRNSMLLLAVAASVIGFAFLAKSWTAPTEPSWLTSQCHSALLKLESDGGGGQPPTLPTPAVLATVMNQLIPMKFVDERPLTALSAKLKGTLYHLEVGDGRKIVLMRLPALPSVRGVSSRFSILSTRSGGWSMAAMCVGNETIVLAARCTDQQLLGYLRLRETT